MSRVSRQEVIVDFYDGNPDRPIITGRVYNAEQMSLEKGELSKIIHRRINFMIKDNSFQEERRDGKIITETMSVQDVINNGWGIDQVVIIRWKSETGSVEVKNSDGILAEVLPDRSGVVALVSVGKNDVLTVFNSDGTERLIIPNHQNVAGNDINGIFEWFEPSNTDDGVSFGVVFSDKSSGVSYQLDIDPKNGQIISETLNR